MSTMNIAEVNQKNRKFWASRSNAIESLLSDHSITAIAKQMYDNYASKIPLQNQPGYESILENAAWLSKLVKATLSQRGGLEKRHQELDDFILIQLAKDRRLSNKKLYALLKESIGSFVVAMDNEIIQYTAKSGTLRQATVSGLGSRLSRVRKSQYRN